MIIMYDQLGCGKSYLDGHPEMWTQDLWLDELDALREHLGLKECHIIGQSWGGMMQIAYAIERGAKGVKSFIISSGHPSSCLLYTSYRIFYYVTTYKSFSKAAKVLGSNQPNITHFMNNLENQLGCRLFVRSNRGVTLTQEGELLYQHVRIAYQQLHAAEVEDVYKRQALWILLCSTEQNVL